jgi:DNA-directed RNA polymerase specialized sigma24 family protein
MVYIVTKADSPKFAAAAYRYKRKSVLDKQDAEPTESYDHQTKALLRLDLTPCISDLAEHRWRLPLLTAAEEIELVRRVRAGDRRAFNRLLANVHGLVLKTADRHMPRYWRWRRLPRKCRHTNNLFFEDLVAEGCFAVWQAVPGFDLDGGYRFWTYARQRVSGAISDAARKWRRGGSGDGRLDRWLYSHPHASPEEVLSAQQKLLKRPIYRSLRAAGDAIKLFWAWRSNPEQDYSTTTEAGAADDIEGSGSLASPGSNKYVLARQVARLYDCFNKYKLSLQLRHHNRFSRLVDELAGEKGEVLDRRPAKARRPKAPQDLRDFSETATIRFKDGSKRKVIRQEAASPVRHIPVEPWMDDAWIRRMLWQANIDKRMPRARQQHKGKKPTHDREIRKRRTAATGVRGAGVGRRGNGARSAARPHQPQLHLSPGAGQRPAGTRIASREGGLK